MSSIVNNLYNQKVINCASYVSTTQYEVITGSESYGVSSNDSDRDIVGICIPPKETIFPHLKGQIDGFGRQIKRFEQWQQHHLTHNSKTYDLSVYNIVKFFQLAMENNPNIIDILFIPLRCILHATKIGHIIRDNRKEFLHKGAWFKFKGYAYSQINKVKDKNLKQFVELCQFKNIDPTIVTLKDLQQELELRPKGQFSNLDLKDLGKTDLVELINFVNKKLHGTIGTRINTIVKYGYDVKFAMHCVRLMNQIEQILIEHDLDLERNREQLKSIRRGEWTLTQVEEYFQTKERDLEELYTKSDLKHSPDESKIKNILLNCLEEYYGSIDHIQEENTYKNILLQVQDLVRNIN